MSCQINFLISLMVSYRGELLVRTLLSAAILLSSVEQFCRSLATEVVARKILLIAPVESLENRKPVQASGFTSL